MAVIIVLMLGAVGFTGMCSFNPGPPKPGPVQEVDAGSFLALEARGVDWDMRMPQTPEGWVTNSARRTTVLGQPADVVGWVTENHAYIQLLQTGQPLDKTIDDIDEVVRHHAKSVTIGSDTWNVYLPEDKKEDTVWAIHKAGTTLVLQGTGTEAEFTLLATATSAATPLPKN